MHKREDSVAAALFEVIVIVIALLLYAWMGADKREYRAARYVVCAGDTLDGLYYRYGGGDYHRWRYEMKKANNMTDSGLYIGNEITVLEAEQ